MKKYSLLIFFSLMISSCSTWKKELSQNGNNEIAIKNAIIDFYNTSYLVKKDKVFNLYSKEYNSGIVGVSIIGNINKIYVVNGSPEGRIKDQYIEYKGRLFCWYDDEKGRDPNIIKKLSEYKVIDSVKAFTEDMGYLTDDKKKGASYYFCKDNLLIYKKETTSIAMPREMKNDLNCK